MVAVTRRTTAVRHGLSPAVVRAGVLHTVSAVLRGLPGISPRDTDPL